MWALPIKGSDAVEDCFWAVVMAAGIEGQLQIGSYLIAAESTNSFPNIAFAVEALTEREEL